MTEIRKILSKFGRETMVQGYFDEQGIDKAEAAILEAVGMCFYRLSLVKNFNADGFTIAWVKKTLRANLEKMKEEKC